MKTCMRFVLSAMLPLLIAFSSFAQPPSTLCGNLSGTLGPGTYHVTCDITVPSGNSLVIMPGTTLLFDSSYALWVYGSIQAVGTETDSIIFTWATTDENKRWRGIRLSGQQDTCRFAYCRIEHGKAVGTGADKYGGGVRAYAPNAVLEFSHCAIVNNYSMDDAGGMHLVVRSCVVSNCLIAGNYAYDDYGGDGIGGLTVSVGESCLMEYTVVANNTARRNGGAMASRSAGSTPIIRNCTFYGNSDNGRGSVFFTWERNGRAHLVNCILWNNPQPMFNQGDYTAEFSDIQGGYAGTGNIDADPLFANAAGGNFHLTANSPCIDAGDPTMSDPDCTRSDIGAFYFHHLAAPPILVHIGEHFCLHFEPGVPQVVYWCCPLDGPPHFLTLPGCEYQVPGCMETCPPYGGPVTITAQYDSSTANCPLPGGWWSARFTAEGEGCVCVFFDWQESVELIDFAATASDRNVMLTWATASETDNDRFEIHRASEGGAWSRISTVAGHGTSSTAHHYSYLDEAVQTGTTYRYRLASVDLNGAMEWVGDIVSATPTAADITPETYALHQNHPNPFNPSTEIVFEIAGAGQVALKVFNVAGQEVATLLNAPQNSGLHRVTFDGSALPSGVYFYSLSAGDFSATRKMLLLK